MDESYLDDLRKALNHLHDLKELGFSPLIHLFGIKNPFEAPIRLQRILEDAIAALKPKPVEPQGTRSWQIYELLILRYLQQFSQKEVADQLGVSLSSMNRIQQQALVTLASYLWEKYNLSDQISQILDMKEVKPDLTLQTPEFGEDLAWLALPSPEKLANLAEHLTDVLALVQPILTKYKSELEVSIPVELPDVLVYPTALRQILLILLTVTTQITGGGRVCLRATRQDKGIGLYLDGHCQDTGQFVMSEDMKANLGIAARLTHGSDGVMDYQYDSRSIHIALNLPIRASLPILVIDDSQDFLKLLRRFVADTRYRLLITSNPQQAISLAEQSGAQVIIVDVMMPRVDGWMLLQQLRNHPSTANIPVVICSILRQEELASSMGASTYLRKPVNQEEFLKLLDRLTEHAVSVSH